MSKHRIGTLALAGLLSTLVVEFGASGQGVRVDYPPPPETLAGLWEASPLVVHVKIGGARVSTVTTPTGAMVFRTYGVAIIEVFKGAEFIGDRKRIEVAQLGGTAKTARGVLVTNKDDMRRLNQGTEEFLFLMPWAGHESYVIAFGPAGAFERKGDALVVPYVDRRMSAFSERSEIALPEFVRILGRLQK